MNLIMDFEMCWLDFYMDVDSKKGVNKEKLQNLERVLICLKKKYTKTGFIPIEVSSIFIDLYSSLESLSYLYPEDEQQEILHIADHLSVLARDVCSCK